jgi:hypothetical protein
MLPGNANLPIGVLLIGLLQTANQEIRAPGICTNIICSISDSRYEKPVALRPRIHYAPDL